MNAQKLVRALLKGNIVEGTRLFSAEMRERIVDALELRRIQVGKKLIGEAARKKTSLAIRTLTEAPMPVSKNGLVPIKVITSHVGLSRWMAELTTKDGKPMFDSPHWNPVCYIENQSDIPSPYNYSPCRSVFKWKGKRVTWFEVSHKRYQVYELPADIKTYTSDDAATSAYIASKGTRSEAYIREDATITPARLISIVSVVAKALNLSNDQLTELVRRVRLWERDWQQDRSVTTRTAQTMITNIGLHVRDGNWAATTKESIDNNSPVSLHGGVSSFAINQATANVGRHFKLKPEHYRELTDWVFDNAPQWRRNPALTQLAVTKLINAKAEEILGIRHGF